jgi:hypothetical protein
MRKRIIYPYPDPDQRFGHWRILCERDRKNGHLRFWCICDCGTVRSIRECWLHSGESISCGCVASLTCRTRRHGHCDADNNYASPEYRTWAAMHKRCINPNQGNYKNYGGRGIVVCAHWREFTNFLADMGRRPSPDHSIDRYPNNRGNYEPGNCRWATREEQSFNRSVTVFVEFEGSKVALIELATRYEVRYDLLYWRVRKGWPLIQALTRPVGRHLPKLVT